MADKRCKQNIEESKGSLKNIGAFFTKAALCHNFHEDKEECIIRKCREKLRIENRHNAAVKEFLFMGILSEGD